MRDAIRAGRRPLGYLLGESGLPYRNRPASFFRVVSTPELVRAMALRVATMLYGRRNLLLNDASEPLADVVEILAPYRV